MTICTRCGRENPDDARFCNRCGAPLGDPESYREERKVVSVLFADLVGFTSRAEAMDPEDVRALQDPYWEYVRSELERHGGTVEKFIGDAVVALFGAPVAHEDDPERAVRAALSIRDWAREQDDVRVRIAVTTGEALVRLAAQPLAGEGMASGDVVNTASRLQGVAPANGILVDQRTNRATSHVIDYRKAESFAAKGKAEPLAVWEAVEARSRFGVDVISHERTPLVGRARELDVTLATLARVRAERAPQLLTIVGVPGIGKSRLVYELMQAVDADSSAIVTWRQGRSLPYGDGVTFWALAEMVKAQAGILETDADEEVRGKLARTVRQVVADDAEAGWVEASLGPLIGLGATREVSGERSAESAAAWRRFFEALAEWRPLVLVFEDLHWADEALLDFLDGLVEWVIDVPLLVVATARPELLARCPNWGGGKANATTLSLSPLSEEETGQLIEGLLERSLMPAEMRPALSAHAEGNALYAEQYVRMLAEQGHAEKLPMPETVQGIIAARLDSLSEAEESLLQDASVFGKVFWDGAVLALDGVGRADAEMRLRALARKEFVQRARRSSVAGENEYAFRHVLFRDVAYSQIPRAARVEKHGRAAAWIESLGRPEDHAEMLAHHYVSALELARAAGGSTDALVPRARAALSRAGDRALSVNAFDAAAGYFEQALELWSELDSERPRVLFGYARALFGSGHDDRGDALEEARHRLYESGDVESAAEADAMLAEVCWYRGQWSRLEAHLDRALIVVADRPASPAKAAVLSSLARFRMLGGKYEEAIDLARSVLELAEALDLQELRAQAFITLGTAKSKLGDLDDVRDLEEGVQIALENNALSAASRGCNNLAEVFGSKGEFGRRHDFLLEGERLAKRLGDRDGTRFISAQLIYHRLHNGTWDEALQEAEEFIAEGETGSPHRQEQNVRLARARIWCARDDVDVARAECEKAVLVARDTQDPQWLVNALSEVVEIYTQAGLLDEARSLAYEILAFDPKIASAGVPTLALVANRIGLDKQQFKPLLKHVPIHNIWRRVSELLVAGDFEAVGNMSAGFGLKDFEAEMRTRAAEVLLKEGRRDEARRQLEQALTFYRSVSATRFIREAEELMTDTIAIA